MSPFLRMLHVAPRLRGGWEVRYTGSHKPLRIWHLKRYAEQFARDRRVPGQRLVIHRMDGSVSRVVG